MVMIGSRDLQVLLCNYLPDGWLTGAGPNTVGPETWDALYYPPLKSFVKPIQLSAICPPHWNHVHLMEIHVRYICTVCICIKHINSAIRPSRSQSRPELIWMGNWFTWLFLTAIQSRSQHKWRTLPLSIDEQHPISLRCHGDEMKYLSNSIPHSNLFQDLHMSDVIFNPFKLKLI